MKNKWMKKAFVALVTTLTFGMVTPFQTIQAENNSIDHPEKNGFIGSETNTEKENLKFTYGTPIKEPVLSPQEYFVKQAIQIGEEQSWKKFGDKIGPVIEDEFQQIILPKIERTITEVSKQFKDEDFAQLAISEGNGKGLSEKIFHIYNEKTDKDVIRFHVRRDLRPLEGYWFNFHYHTYHDDFQTHYELGDIFWDKNTPPKWAN